jgi:DNA-directed RNA polymerase subunit D
MPITKLKKGQSIELEAKAVLGKGKAHVKWSPGHIYYYNEAKISVNNDDKLSKEFKDKYPPQIFDNGKIDRNLINTPALIDACEGISKLVEIEKKEDSFVFVLESWGQLAPKTILIEAIDQINKQFDKLADLMK